MKILPVVSTKGGEGKSTQSANLAGFLADAGIRTLLIDGDHAQPTASNIFPLTYEASAGLFELLMRTADLSYPDNIISRTAIDGLDLIVSNDPHEQLKTAMLHAPDGRLRLRNVLQHPLFLNNYDVIIVDSQGARSVMLEMIVLSATDSVVGMVNPVLPDVREFIRGTVNVMENLLPYRNRGYPCRKYARWLTAWIIRHWPGRRWMSWPELFRPVVTAGSYLKVRFPFFPHRFTT